MFNSLLLIPPVFAAIVGLYLWLYLGSRRSAADVVEDLNAETYTEQSTGVSSNNNRSRDELIKAGVRDSRDHRRFILGQRAAFLVVLALALMIPLALGKSGVSEFVPFVLLAVPIGYLLQRFRLRKFQNEEKQNLEFFLPLVMERVVMAAEAGLDIIPALSAVVKVEEQNSIASFDKLDPVTRLLKMVSKLTDAGVGFEQALAVAAAKSDSYAVRHAFIHLGLAQKEGGELIMPLRELSDATQLHFQESVEEAIAKMPAKATLPLLCTFTGLVTCFLTPAMLQVIAVLERSIPK